MKRFRDTVFLWLVFVLTLNTTDPLVAQVGGMASDGHDPVGEVEAAWSELYEFLISGERRRYSILHEAVGLSFDWGSFQIGPLGSNANSAAPFGLELLALEDPTVFPVALTCRIMTHRDGFCVRQVMGRVAEFQLRRGRVMAFAGFDDWAQTDQESRLYSHPNGPYELMFEGEITLSNGTTESFVAGPFLVTKRELGYRHGHGRPVRINRDFLIQPLRLGPFPFIRPYWDIAPRRSGSSKLFWFLG